MGVERDRRDWQELAELDPYWAALTDESKRAGAWDPADFARSGSEEVERLLEHAPTLGAPAGRDAALDFGCGPGRLTRALAAHFRSSVGVDLSERMVREARKLNRDVENCRFLAGDRALQSFDDQTFDLVYSNLVLQHVSDEAAVTAYVAEFVRLLAPGGLVAFQVPSHLPVLRRLQPRRRLYHGLRRTGIPPRVLYRRLGLDPVGMHAVASASVTAVLERAGARIIRVDEARWSGGTRSATYFATR
jgi:SAM-dependent methyltransferase